MPSCQSAKKIAGLNNANTSEGFQLPQVAIAGNNHVSLSGQSTF
jgi:hypothetical protein